MKQELKIYNESGELIRTEMIDVPNAPDPMLDRIGEMFTMLMAQTTDVALRVQYRASQRDFLAAKEAGDSEAVIYVLRNQPVPAESEPLKQRALALLEGAQNNE